MEYGLIGKTLGHSFSKPIHEALGGYPYELKELPCEAAARAFFAARSFRAVNVTIPYKALALEACDEVSEEARAIGAVNTVVNRGGRLFGYNTDFDGFRLLVRRRGVSLAGKTVLILGTGATQRTVRAVCAAEGAAQVLCASRSEKPGALRYEQAAARQDVNVIVNASPAGMYPDNGTCLVDLAAPGAFPALEAVFDVVYNPLRTRLVQMAGARGVPCAGGLLMLVAQAKYAAELFLGAPIEERRILEIYRGLLAEKAGLALVGMPSCGKTGVGKALAKALKKPFVDADAELVRRAGRPISEILRPGERRALPPAGGRRHGRPCQARRRRAGHGRGRGAARRKCARFAPELCGAVPRQAAGAFEARRRQAAERHARGAGGAACRAAPAVRGGVPRKGGKRRQLRGGGGRRKGGIL